MSVVLTYPIHPLLVARNESSQSVAAAWSVLSTVFRMHIHSRGHYCRKRHLSTYRNLSYVRNSFEQKTELGKHVSTYDSKLNWRAARSISHRQRTRWEHVHMASLSSVTTNRQRRSIGSLDVINNASLGYIVQKRVGSVWRMNSRCRDPTASTPLPVIFGHAEQIDPHCHTSLRRQSVPRSRRYRCFCFESSPRHISFAKDH